MLEADISRYYGDGWLEKWVAKNPSLKSLDRRKQVEAVAQTSIHGQTDFFREPSILQAFKVCVLPQLQALQIASVGCSDGREVYSIALDNWKQDLHIDGYDANPALIEEARIGKYHISSGMRADLRELQYKAYAYTVRRGRRHCDSTISFTKRMQQRVSFQVHNILDAPLPRRYDALFLMNMLWHYTPAGREQILRNCHASIKESGFLVCERTTGYNDRREYESGMKNISHLGFRKHPTVFNWWFAERDESIFTQVHRRM